MDSYGQATPALEEGKMFVGGLSWSTTKESLRTYFSKYGEITDSIIMTDPATGKPRGFGFVTFKDPASVAAVLNPHPPQQHIIDEKVVDPKLATVKGGQPSSTSSGQSDTATSRKIFVGGLSNGTTDDDVLVYFTQLVGVGQVKNVELKFDKATNRMRGFGFVEFDSEAMVNKVTQQQYHQICGKSVEVKKAEPRNPVSKQAQGYSAASSAAANYRSIQHQGYGYQYPGGHQPHGYDAQQYYGYYNYPFGGNQQASATPQQMGGGGGYGQDSNVTRSGGYNTVAAGYNQYPAQGASTYEPPQANQGVATPYQQPSYPNNQATAPYNQPTGGRNYYQ